MVSWLEKPGQSIGWQIIQSSDEKKMCKYLPPGNIMELYHHYVSTRQLLGVSLASFAPKLISIMNQKHHSVSLAYHCACLPFLSLHLTRYSTFKRVYMAKWQDVLKFRAKTLTLGSTNPWSADFAVMCLDVWEKLSN